ncbi:Nicotinate-nucleotide diphosphorylase (carboxylating) [Thioalkalivibrio sulfidiphilus HL-EbGr7]|uniref:Probable nicotinate-nucleotide pyrophosphorylase [carboxylating] n=1 Tax=Thioalkalivibrio sulfidiphilus (strain HL-EbGR7) TaxID=396588 RepID=B8GN28_THISH|nr:carboxylating nicotinate-nucleotide diphosphorylase [Thioalkalivibrio sulfidiphilus]ACL71889.1 Nicotinate-nucleotide diphosphorylase (carboxylating) [Thioalkalivibrio sulfidiphilus HL-EbGr7]
MADHDTRPPAAPSAELIREQVRLALVEDVGSGDVTAALIPEDAIAHAHVLCRVPAVVCGSAWFDEAFAQLDPRVVVGWHVAEGEQVEADTRLCSLRGPARALLTGERTALNFLQLLSATATATRAYVDAAAGTGARILDTRKTLPGLRVAQKYAVACGGGRNHRLGLYDAVLIKENHIHAAGSIAAAVETARRTAPGLMVEVETETLDEVDQALAAGADVIMLDDFPLERMREAVGRVAGRVKLEASGGVSLDTVKAIAETGVDYISVGSITKDVVAVDLSMRFE